MREAGGDRLIVLTTPGVADYDGVALRSALGIIVHSLFVGAATGFGTTSVV